MWHRLQKSIFLLVAWLALLPCARSEAALRATVDRQQILSGETITLTLHQDNPRGAATPDLSVLKEGFQILDTQKSQRIQITNGSRSASIDWIIALLPRNTGTTTLPAIAAGAERTRPIQIEMLPPGPRDSTALPSLFMEATLDSDTALVGSETLYTVRIFDRNRMQSGTLQAPQLADAKITEFGDSSTTEVIRNGQRYTLHQQNFRIIPEKSGLLTIPPAILEARLQPSRQEAARRRQGRSGGMLGDLFGRFAPTGPIQRITTPALTLQVQPRPIDKPGWFLPAKSVELSEVWSAQSGTLEEGEALTRTVTLRALGAASEQLPEFVIPAPPQGRQYDEGSREGARPSPDGTLSVRETKVTIVPTQVGLLAFPALEVRWFDVATKEMRIARLPARKFEVLHNTQGSESSVESRPQIVITPPVATALSTVPWAANLWYWPVALILGLLCLVGGHWLLPYGSRWIARRPAVERRALAQAVRVACRQSQPAQARTAFLHWVAYTAGADAARNITTAIRHLQDPQLGAALEDLEKCLFGAPGNTWSGSSLLIAFSQLRLRPAAADNADRQKAKALPQLYPSR